jgi:hypothetical protein
MKKTLLIASLALSLFSCTKSDPIRTAKVQVVQKTSCNSSYYDPQTTTTTTSVTGTSKEISDAISKFNTTSTSSSGSITCTVTQSAHEI